MCLFWNRKSMILVVGLLLVRLLFVTLTQTTTPPTTPALVEVSRGLQHEPPYPLGHWARSWDTIRYVQTGASPLHKYARHVKR
ncbi:uncharacterized protein CLUP02_18181 [Colletotrichum lupini]|uniref:Secreted protein n=1 Tax=Colletotrichum lupini TaxID=145971 RepID=A0A9Q8SHN5_9PEZI|nr:uncharacterized protein CLUP02_18181 [Colletotrichum lupini]KAK1707907.1 hypothetical protein BDP67DRAFT_526547 [Colletotrichum lupini]UQC76667.1 hypothetical protein CLUP02_18181 [Colletotrichum lupini]